MRKLQHIISLTLQLRRIHVQYTPSMSPGLTITRIQKRTTCCKLSTGVNKVVLHLVNNVVLHLVNNVVLHLVNNVVLHPVVNKVVQPSILSQLVTTYNFCLQKLLARKHPLPRPKIPSLKITPMYVFPGVQRTGGRHPPYHRRNRVSAGTTDHSARVSGR